MRDKDQEAPFKSGSQVALTVTDLSSSGYGVGKAEGFTIFTDGALPGEDISAEVNLLKTGYAEAALLTINRAAGDRVEPACPHFPLCGGCRLQHLAYSGQLAWKEKMVAGTLQRIATIEADVKPIIGMADPWRFRNKAQLHIGYRDGAVLTGFYHYRSNEIINIGRCPVQHPANEKLVGIIRHALGKFFSGGNKSRFRAAMPAGAMTRTSFASGKCSVVLVPPPGKVDMPLYRELTGIIRSDAGSILGGVALLHRKKGALISTALAGNPELVENVAGFRFRISPLSFFQANPRQAALLFAAAVSCAAKPATAVDLYCGTGSLTIFLSKEAKKVIGVDSEKAAIDDAHTNAALNNAANVSFINAKAEDCGPQLLEAEKPLTVFLNPPRRGCSEKLLAAVSSARPDRIVYLSCNPATLARDLAILVKKCYRVLTVQPIDMFPHTTHVETVASISRVD